MYRFRHILAELNLDHADTAVARYSAMITKLTNSTELIFSHVKSHIHAREEALIDDDIFLPTQEEVASDKIEQTITAEYNGNPATKTELLIKEGRPLKFLLEQIKEHETDLVIIGREPHSYISRKLPIKLARKAPCSVLIVPEDAKAEINSIVVPIDFSHHAKDAVDIAIEFAVDPKADKST